MPERPALRPALRLTPPPVPVLVVRPVAMAAEGGAVSGPPCPHCAEPMRLAHEAGHRDVWLCIPCGYWRHQQPEQEPAASPAPVQPRQPCLPGSSPPRRSRRQVQADAEEMARLRVQYQLDSLLEARLLRDLQRRGVPDPIPQYMPSRERAWKIDFAWPDRRVAVEVHGGTWSQGRHVRGHGYRQDCEKARHLAMAGWLLLPYTGDDVEGRDGADPAREIEQALEMRRTEAGSR